MSGPVDEIDGVKGKSRKGSTDTWAEYLSGLGDFFTQPIVNNNQKNESKDTISSAANDNKSQAPKSAGTSSNEIVNLGKKVWDFFAAPVVNNVEAGTAGKPGGIGSPSLEAPFQIDMKLFAKLMNELRGILKKISEACFEMEDEIRDAERVIMMWLIDYLKKQKVLREDGARDMKTDVIFRTKKGQEIGKELIDTENLKNELAKDQKFWGTVNKYVTWGALALTAIAVATVAIPALFASGGTATAPLMAAAKIGLQISQSLLGVTSGCTQLMKANLDKKVGEHKEKATILQEAHSTEILKVKMMTDQMNEWFGKSLTISGWMRQVGENDRQANLDMISISPPSAPAA